MRLLLDTHVFLWFAADSPKLSSLARESIRRGTVVHVSVVSVWEIAIKYAAGKFGAPDDDITALINDCISQCGCQILPVKVEHALLTASLPLHHRDPFDRMLVAQTIAEELTLVSHDKTLARYACKVLW